MATSGPHNGPPSKRPRSAHKRNTDGLKVNAQKKAEETKRRAMEAIDRLESEQQAVSFLSVAKASGVAKCSLYAHADVRARIEALRQHQGGPRLRLVSGPVQEAGRTEKSKDVLLAAKDGVIERLERENRELKGRIKALEERVKTLNGRLYTQL